MYVKIICVSLKHLLLWFPAGARARGRGALAGTVGAASDTPTQEGEEAPATLGSAHSTATSCTAPSQQLLPAKQPPCLQLQLLCNPREAEKVH